ncbi:hypothetical protein C3747_115g132 [Trypanosoma cruzi]|uniref:Uncharacterized protein n=2 Tax=Trypanosoma cruzi TaxID=5693 RepID=Q4D3R9_TRYCC|nr:hypothetical protein, conserved [Trypanosoma cruzi]EAN87177.1 hypothetical protein, conserved [Trypanosoma cruzi]PWV06421.1 hypothetical protein C3747_115g132 [Trypanosoma cruzi]RNC51869.1 hypothetical protein TcCL_ESM10971 [Trypanosoma cruzi]|eukprot:XP_809028.1 hypothetical protein [Trypanosoma cruzi strain CL Brener]
MWTAVRGTSALRRVNSPMLRCRWRRSVTFTSSEKAASSRAATLRTGTYSVKGYDFVEGFHVLGPGAALSRLKATLSMYGLLGVTVISSIAYYLTTRTYELTTDPDPLPKSRFQKFPSDYAVLRNRWTGKRHVIALRDGDANDNDTREGKQHELEESAILKKRIRVNWLIHSVRLYLHVTDSIVVVDLDAECDPYHFALKRNRGSLTTSEVANHVGEPATARLLCRSRLRPIVIRNEYQKGTLPQYERTVDTVTRELFGERYRQAILSRSGSILHPVFADELLKSGELNGKEMSWTDVVGDNEAFSAEIQRRVQKKLGEKVILLQFSMRVL